jgi:hypothetical protein
LSSESRRRCRETHLSPPITIEDRERIPDHDCLNNLRPTRVLRSSDPTPPHLRVQDKASWRQSLRNHVEENEGNSGLANENSQDINADVVMMTMVEDSDNIEDYEPDSNIEEEDVDISSVVNDNFNLNNEDNKEHKEEQEHEGGEEEDSKLPAYLT